MAFSLGGLNFGGMITGWVTSTGFWMLFAMVLLMVIWGGLVMRKRKMLDKPVLILYDLSPCKYDKDGRILWDESLGIMDFEITRGGWFREKFTLKGLIDYGNEKLFRLKDMTPVFDVSHNDYRKINGQNGIVVVRNPADPKFVVPISKFALSKNAKTCMAEIAPVDLRNAATAAIEQVDHEMKSTWEKWAPIITIAIVAFVLIFSILLIAQYGKHNIDATTETLKYAVDALKGNVGEKAAALISKAP